MNRLLSATALATLLSMGASGAYAHEAKSHNEADAWVVKASYSLPKKDGDDFRQTLHEADEENLNLKQQVALGHAELYDLLTAPDFDRKAFIDKAAEVRKAKEQMHENRDEAFAAAAEQLTPEERRTLAAALESSAPHKRMHHHPMNSDDQRSSNEDNTSSRQ